MFEAIFLHLSFKALIKFIGRKVALMHCRCNGGTKAKPLRPWISGAGAPLQQPAGACLDFKHGETWISDFMGGEIWILGAGTPTPLQPAGAAV